MHTGPHTFQTDYVDSLIAGTVMGLDDGIKADSHVTCRAHAVPLPCRLLVHTCHAVPLPCSDSVVSFLKVRMVGGNIRAASSAV